MKREEVKNKQMTKTKFATAIATGALLLNAFTPFAFADTSLEISGNGSLSTNDAKVKTTTNTTVVQNNSAYIKNDIDASGNTGGNDANDNTGGDVFVDTGDAVTIVDVATKANLNVADVNCDTCGGDSNVKISGNGSESDNNAKVKNTNDTSVFQDNKAKIKNDIDATAKTGYNDANRNTGGDVTVKTGDAGVKVDVLNAANANLAKVGGNQNSSASANAVISGNGSFSKNDVKLDFDRDVLIKQDNHAYVKNDIDAEAKTGKNDANDNTAGIVLIDTGSAKSVVDVANFANFNWANVDCCFENVSVKISGNGTESDNQVKADFKNDLQEFQDNKAKLKNDVDAVNKTGKNDANRNTGIPNDGVAVLTGDSASSTSVSNAANVNLAGKNTEVSLPSHIDFSFDLSDLLAFFHS